MNAQGPEIAVIGGGTGNAATLSGLKPYVGERLSAIVGMADDGGSTGMLRDEYGALPPGDIRQCLVALSDAPQAARDLLNYRFSSGRSAERGIAGQSLGNLIISAAEKQTGNMNAALDMISSVFTIRGQVVPVTLDDRRLRITTADGLTIEGEHVAETTDIASLKGATIGFDKQPTVLNERAEAAIKAAGLVVIAPGDLYTSIAPALAVSGMREALLASGPVVQVTNIMNRGRHTKGFKVSDYAAEVERIIGAPVLSRVLYNTSPPNRRLLRRYAEQDQQYPVAVDEPALRRAHFQALGRPLLSRVVIQNDANDELAASRSLIRHDPHKLARAILDVYEQQLR